MGPRLSPRDPIINVIMSGTHRHEPYHVPPSPTQPVSPTGSLRSVASKTSTRSRMKGASNFITKGLKKLRKKESSESWLDKPAGFTSVTYEKVPTSQETQDADDAEDVRNEALDAARAKLGLSKPAADKEEDSSSEEEDDDSDDEVAPPTTGRAASPAPLTLAIPDSAEDGTPPNVPGSLPDPELTPKSPRVAVATNAEVYKLRVMAQTEDESNALFNPSDVPITNTEFYAHVGQSKTNTGDIVDEEIRGSSPAFDESMFTFGDPEIEVVYEKFSEIGRLFGRITPRQSTNPEVLASIAKDFFSSFTASDWSLVPVDGVSIKGMLGKEAKFWQKKVTFERESASTNNPPADPAPSAMEVDSSPPRITTSQKGKGKAILTPTPPKAAAPIKPASPIKVSAVPRPLPTNPGPSKASGKGNRNPAWVAKLHGKNVYEAHFDSVTQAALLEGKSQLRDTQSAPRASQAAAPQRDNSSARISSDTSSSKAKPPPPPVPMDSRPAAHAKFLARAQTTAQGRTSRDKPKRMSYAQTAAIQKNAAVIPALSAESIQWAKEL
jgi:hypothetical protein